MGIWKNGKTTEEITHELLRNYFIRCHGIVSQEYPEIAGMTPENAADYLLHLKKTGRVDIKLYYKSLTQLGCRITELQQNKEL